MKLIKENWLIVVISLIINEVQEIIAENQPIKTLHEILQDNKNNNKSIEQLENQLLVPINCQERNIKILEKSLS